MPAFRVPAARSLSAALGLALALNSAPEISRADDKPTGAPLVMSPIETEQPIPLAVIEPDGKTAKCVIIRLHWNLKPDFGPNDDNASFDIDLPPDNPGAAIFTAQLWSASLASALAWQEPWEGARWKVLQTPATDGTGLDAALAVGMIATSARRPYPEKTILIGSLNPDGSLGPVSHLIERLDASAREGMKRVIIPSVQRFDQDASGQVQNMVRHASELHLECIPVDNLVDATQAVMNDPLPDSTLDSSTPKYSNDVSNYIDDFAHREQAEMTSGLKFAPKEADLASYPPRLAATWRTVYADYDAGQQAYRAGQVYVAYEIFNHANGLMNGASALAGQNPMSFDVKQSLADSEILRDHLRSLMNPPAIDKGGLVSSLLVAEMADWAYEINASLEGAQLVTKQTFSQRTDATPAEKDRAREALLFAIGQCRYLLNGAQFYNGLLGHLTEINPVGLDESAAHLWPQLVPAQLATARNFVDGIRAGDLREGLLFDSRLVAYVNVLRETKAAWDARLRKKEDEAPTPAPAPASTAVSTNAAPIKPDAAPTDSAVGFDPGNTYAPPHTVVAAAEAAKVLSDPAHCLIWVNHECEIATLDEKYLRLNGTIDPATHEWHVKDRARLDQLLQAAEIGARHGIAFAQKAEVDPSVLAMIYERAAHSRIQDDDASALEALRNYWRCALLGNVCWQLAHTRKAEPVDLSTVPPAPPSTPQTAHADAASTNKIVVVTPPTAPAVGPEKSAASPEPAPVAPVVEMKPAPVPAPPPKPVVEVNPAPPPAKPVVVVSPAPAVPQPEAAPVENPTLVVNPRITPGTPPGDEVPVAPRVASVEPIHSPTPRPAPQETSGPVVPPPNQAGPVDPPIAPVASQQEMEPAVPANRPARFDPPVAPIASDDDANIPVAPIARHEDVAPPPKAGPAPHANPGPVHQPPAVTATIPEDANIPVAPIAKAQDYVGGDTSTNSAPVGPIAPSAPADNADGHAGAFP